MADADHPWPAEMARHSLAFAKRLSPFDSTVREVRYADRELVSTSKGNTRRRKRYCAVIGQASNYIICTVDRAHAGQLGAATRARRAFSHWVSLAPGQVELMTRDRALCTTSSLKPGSSGVFAYRFHNIPHKQSTIVCHAS